MWFCCAPRSKRVGVGHAAGFFAVLFFAVFVKKCACFAVARLRRLHLESRPEYLVQNGFRSQPHLLHILDMSSWYQIIAVNREASLWPSGVIFASQS